MENNTNLSHAVRSGAIVGLISIVFSMAVYIINVTLFSQFFIILGVSLTISIGFGVFYGNQHRKQLGGYKPFGQAFLHAFILFYIAGILGTVFNYVLFVIIDPDAAKTIQEASLERIMSMMERFGASEADIDKAMAEAREKMEDEGNSFSLGNQAINLLTRSIPYAIGALIVGAITQKKDPNLEL